MGSGSPSTGPADPPQQSRPLPSAAEDRGDDGRAPSPGPPSPSPRAARTTATGTTAASVPHRMSARVRIPLLLLVALAAVAATTRSVLLRDVDHRVERLLSRRTGGLTAACGRGAAPSTGARFHDARRLLRVFLERQYAGPGEESTGLVGRAGGRAPGNAGSGAAVRP
ncbi:hypothetical protein Sgou_12230 [Streptomyces gougerotii]|nr:hypothetical protein Sgou_12230 [Streptomyces gougerotii]SUP38322.1 Two component system sensor histidine kinase [Streptomyces griseus]